MSSPYLVDTVAGPLSGRIAGPTGGPRGLVVALHGGTYDSGYYDSGESSLLGLADALGLCVVALDRPGYGAATGFDPKWFTFDAQAELLAEATAQTIRQVRPVDGTVLVGHSIGGMIALKVAAAGGPVLRGVEVSGLGARWQPGMLEMWSSFVGDAPAIEVPAEPHAQVMFGPAGTYAEGAAALDARLIRPMPMPELVDVVSWADTFPTVAGSVAVPVSLSFPEHDRIWQTDVEARDASARLFTGSPAVRVELIRGSGHCTELHRPARSYCLRQFAFVEECLAS